MIEKVLELLELFVQYFKDDEKFFNEGDYVPEGHVEEIDMSLRPSDLARELSDKYDQIVLQADADLNKYLDGQRLGTKQCSRFVCDILGVRPIVWSAQELFGRLCQEQANGHVSNLKTDFGQLEVGDVVFFHGTYNNGRTITHAGVISSTQPLQMRHHATFMKGIQTVDLEGAEGNYYREHFYAAVTPVKAGVVESE